MELTNQTVSKTVGATKKTDLERKMPVTVYITGEQVQILGGIAEARNLSLNYLKSKVKKAK